MEKRILGRTGLDVTVLGYGGMAISPGPDQGVTDDDADRLLNRVLDAGINFIDTSPDYGLSEERIGRFVSHRRDEYLLATKCGCNVPRPEGSDEHHIWTRQQLMHNIELSLKRMKVDHVDIWQLHNASVEQVEAGDLVEAMTDVKRQGKVRHVSISSTLPNIDTFIQQGSFETYQIPYSALERQHEEAIRRAAESGAGTIIRGGVARGEPGEALSDHDRWKCWDQAKLDELLSDGESRTAFMLRFTIAHAHMHTTIVGTRNPDHLEENLAAAAAGPLPADVYAEAKRRLDAVGQKPA